MKEEDILTKDRPTMLEQLIEHYENNLKLGNGGHIVCYFNEQEDENIPLIYQFPRGAFSIRTLSGRAIHWDYDPKLSGRNNEIEVDVERIIRRINYWP